MLEDGIFKSKPGRGDGCVESREPPPYRCSLLVAESDRGELETGGDLEPSADDSPDTDDEPSLGSGDAHTHGEGDADMQAFVMDQSRAA